ncbi:MAG TPA: glycosyltransferase [Chloroflexia bacterium]|nr:glycosyltransferase [Chloroflexia bacterium]
MLLLPSWYPTDRYPIGGVFCRTQAQALASASDVDVAVLFVDRAPLREWLKDRRKRAVLRDEEGVKVYRTQMPRLPGVWPFLYVMWACLSLRRLSRRYGFKPDVVHAHVSLPAGLAGALIKRLSGIPLVITEHTSPFSLLMRNPLAALTTRTALRAADRRIAVSKALRGEILAYPRLRLPIDVIPNVVDASAFSAPRRQRGPGEPYRLLFVGEMETRRKGIEYLLNALPILKERELDIHLTLVGEGRNREEYQALARRLGVTGMCHFHGMAPHGEIARFMSEADIFVLPSLAETFGVVLVEAMSAGLPVVATRCGGPEELVTPELGVLVGPADAEALAGGIMDVLSRIDEFSEEHLRRVADERYGQASVAGRLVSLYAEIVGR